MNKKYLNNEEKSMIEQIHKNEYVKTGLCGESFDRLMINV